MQIYENYSLKNHNTFHIDAIAKYFIEIDSPQELNEVFDNHTFNSLPKMAIGEGSNIVFTKNQEKIFLHFKNDDTHIIDENDDFVFLKVGAGKNWHQFVLWAVHHNYGGLENLSLIPGLVGASPIQNIGAYGVEVKDVIDEVFFYHIENKSFQSLKNSDCHFEYRNSIFKNSLKHKVLITEVIFKLYKKPKLKIEYGDIKKTLEKYNLSNITIKNISDAVIEIRNQKLPNPKIIGNAGSFFKNPVIEGKHFTNLKEKFQTIPSYELPNDSYKIPAAWLIEYCKWKGKKIGNVGVHENQPLVLINLGNAKGNEILNLADEIEKSVFDTFQIQLEKEVNIF